MFKDVENATEKGDIRFFSLGIGQDVSHALPLVRQDLREPTAYSGWAIVGMESKVAPMLRGALKFECPCRQLSVGMGRQAKWEMVVDTHLSHLPPLPDFTIPSVIKPRTRSSRSSRSLAPLHMPFSLLMCTPSHMGLDKNKFSI